LPVEGLFLALDAFTVGATVVPRTGRSTAGDVPSFTSNVALRPADEARVQAFITKAQDILMTPSLAEVRVEHDLGAGFGLGSSAAVFAALTVAMNALSDCDVSQGDLASLARLGSYSAAASLVGGLARILPSGEASVVPLPASWDLETVVFPVPPRGDMTEKASTRIHADVVTSPYYESWKGLARDAARQTASALDRADFTEFRNAIEAYVLRNLAVIITGRDSEIPWEAGTLERFHQLRDLRNRIHGDFGVSANSGPSVFAFGSASSIDLLTELLDTQTPEVAYIRSAPGGPAEMVGARSGGEVAGV
jgi:mevalonate pyrophosphate decarboxylase